MDLKVNLKDTLNISNLKNQKELIFIVLVLLATAFFGKKIWEGQKAQLSRINQEIGVCEKKMSLAEDINLLSKKFEELKKNGWLTEESVAIMSVINGFTVKHNIEIINFNPIGLDNRGDYSVFSMQLSIISDYYDLARFLSELEGLETLTKVIYLQVNPERGSSNQDNPIARVSLSINAFISKD